MVTGLITHGADMNIDNTDGDTPLHAAVRADKFDCFAHLLARGADSTVLNADGLMCFDVASLYIKLTYLTRLDLAREVLQYHDYHLWFVIVLEDEPSMVPTLGAKVSGYCWCCLGWFVRMF